MLSLLATNIKSDYYYYKIIFQPTNVTGNSTMGTVDGLTPFTNYNCTIHTVIMTVDGPMSDYIVVRTAEAGKDY